MDHQGGHVGMMNLKHIKIALLPRYLKMGGNHSSHFQSHGEVFFHPVLDLISFSFLHDSFTVCEDLQRDREDFGKFL